MSLSFQIVGESGGHPHPRCTGAPSDGTFNSKKGSTPKKEPATPLKAGPQTFLTRNFLETLDCRNRNAIIWPDRHWLFLQELKIKNKAAATSEDVSYWWNRRLHHLEALLKWLIRSKFYHNGISDWEFTMGRRFWGSSMNTKYSHVLIFTFPHRRWSAIQSWKLKIEFSIPPRNRAKPKITYTCL